MHDGLLDVTVIGALSKPALLWAFPRVFKGTHVTHPAATTFRGEHIELDVARHRRTPMDVYADGERVGPLPASMDAVRDALTVRVRDAEPSSDSGRGSVSRRVGLGRFPAGARLAALGASRRRGCSSAAASASSSVTVSPVIVITPSMPASRWPGIVQ